MKSGTESPAPAEGPPHTDPGNQGHTDPVAAHIMVAGAGVIGLSVAWRLAQHGHRVTVCEKGKIGGEASWAAAGMLSPGGEFTDASELASLAIESRNLYRSFVRELEEASGESVDYQECGALDLAYSDAELQALEEKAAAQAGMAIASKPVSPKHIKAFWPRVDTEGLRGARFYPNDALVDPRDLTRALSTACRRAGVQITEDCGVSHIRVEETWVKTSCFSGVHKYDAAVIAAGAWSGSIQMEGVPPVPETEPVKGQLIGYQQPLQTCNTILRRGHHYIVQRANGLLIVGASMERSGFDRQVSAEVTSTLERVAEGLLPHLAETTPVASWIGFRPGADVPRLGRWHSDRLHLAYGHFRNGILLAPVTSQRVAAGITSSLGMHSGARV